MKFFLVLLVTLIESAQSLQGAERLLSEPDPFAALTALNADNFNLTDSACVFNFTDLVSSDEVTCIANITAPTGTEVTIVSGLSGGNCTNTTIATPSILSVDLPIRANGKVTSTVQFSEIPVPEVQGEVSKTDFCLKTSIQYSGIDMLHQSKPITVEFEYDGSFTITTGVAENLAIGDKVEDKTIFTANAFVCDPDFTPSSKILTIGSILYVCVRPAEDQLTTMIRSVKFFDLSKVDETPYFQVVAVDPWGESQTGTNSAVTVVTGELTRKVIIGCRVPSQFYDTATNITGTGEVILGQLRRLLRSDIALPRYLDEAEEAEEDGSFDLDVKLETRGALSGSVLSSASSKTNLSVVVVLLSALYCFD